MVSIILMSTWFKRAYSRFDLLDKTRAFDVPSFSPYCKVQ